MQQSCVKRKAPSSRSKMPVLPARINLDCHVAILVGYCQVSVGELFRINSCVHELYNIPIIRIY